MDLTPGQQRLVFVVVVLALAGLGIYLLSSRGSGGSPAAAPSPRASTVAPAPGATDGSVPPTSFAPPTPVPTAGGAEIYQWLPFTPADLTAASKATLSFAANYATWNYTQDEAAYGAKLSGLVSPQELASLENSYITPGVASARTAGKQVSTGKGTIDSITAFGAGPAITFTVTITQQVTSAGQPAQATNDQYAVTVATAGGGWQVNDIELANVGNQ